ncbi:MAG: hypothetical protein ACKVZ6_05180 [Kineosporiaceae bacterium]|jgi:hypothetical protein
MTFPIRSLPAARAAVAASALAALLLTGCSAAGDAVQGAQDAASAQASDAVDGAKAKASAKASEVAVAAVRTQLCNLVKDGALSDADAKALDGLVTVGAQAGIPAEVLSAARTVADAGTDASGPQVATLKAKACAGADAAGTTG